MTNGAMTGSVQHWRPITWRKLKARAGYAVVTILLTGVAAIPPAQAQTLTVLRTFTNSPDGAYPVASLFRDATGNLYSTTFQGGNFTENPGGTVFKVTQSGNETVLLSFNGIVGAPGGAFPKSKLIMDKGGNLYGTALEGTKGSGVVFKVSPSGKETVLYSFIGGTYNEKPKVPGSGLIMDKVGNLYGVTVAGGVSSCSHSGNPYCGTVYKLAPNGKLTILHSFTGGSDGGAPLADLIMDEAGNLYGTTFVGGDLNCNILNLGGCGVVFKLDPAGKLTVLHKFTGGSDGAYPLSGGAGLVEDAAGNFYGTAGYGGVFGGACDIFGDGCGTVFKIDKAGKFTVLHRFISDASEGEIPNAGLAIDPAGNLYGTTEASGSDEIGGTIFKVSQTGKSTILYNFDGLSSGATPFGGLIRDSAGNLYGTTYHGLGNMFVLRP